MSTPTLAVLAAAVLVLPVSQAIWIPLTHLRFIRFHRRLGVQPPRLGFSGTLVYYWRALIANLTMAWWLVVALGRDDLRQPIGKASGPPVLCVHGYLRNGTCMWGVRRALGRHGRPTQAVSLGRPLRSIEDYAPPLASALRRLIDAHPGEKVDVIAHSMGGVVLRRVLASEPRLAAAIGRIVTLGSPHHGTAAVAGIPGAYETRQLAPNGSFLQQLPEFQESAPKAEIITVAAELDFVVYPKSTSHLEGARTIELPTSHPGLITETAAIERIVSALTTPGAA